MKILILAMSLILTTSNLQAKNVELLTFDKSEVQKNGLPRNFRDLSQFNLNAIASAQFSQKELQEIRKKFPNEKITIVDLRRESHGFVNGVSVSWREPFDASNVGKTSAQILKDEKFRLNLVKKNGQILVNKILEKDKENGWYEEVKPEILQAQEVETEENLVKKNGFSYKRFVVQDHAKPDEKQFGEMVKFIKSLPQDQKIYVHCAAGKGRTTTFLALYDIIKNGDKLTLDEILKRQHKAGGANLYEVDEESNWRENLAQEKLEMLKKFHAQNLESSKQ